MFSGPVNPRGLINHGPTSSHLRFEVDMVKDLAFGVYFHAMNDYLMPCITVFILRLMLYLPWKRATKHL